ncbi:MAG: helix-turn-helix transcriptional regulator [Chthoniobacterales bacterium]|nr:helix-turn-helix transcriptional regulator [Chthoniobacterales bacterium]
MAPDWLLRISPCPRPVLPGMPEDCSFTGRGSELPGWVEPLRVIYDHQLVLIRHGLFRTRIERKDYACPPNSYLIVPPGSWEESWNVGTDRGQRLWCHFDWNYIGPWQWGPVMTYHPARPRGRELRTAPDFVPEGVLQGKIPNPQLAFDLFDRLFGKLHFGNSHDQLAARPLLLELLIHLLDDREEAVGPEKGVPHLASLVRTQLRNAVESGEPLPSIRRMLEKSRYSYAHLCRVFRAEYGIPPLKYVHGLRIDRAKLLLHDTTLSISEIAYRVGFGDPVYFSELFRKVVGTTPSGYRKAQVGSPSLPSAATASR